VIPEGWQEVRLGQIAARQKYAIVDGPFGSNLKSEHYRSTGIPVIQSGFVTTNRFEAEDYVFVEEELFQQQIRSRVVPGDIVMAKIGAKCGTCAILPESHPTSILAGNSLKITTDPEKCLNHFLLHLLHYRYEVNGLAEVKTETAQPAITIGNLKRLRILLPPLPEQRKIAAILSTWDEGIALTERRIEAARQRKKGLMQRLLTGRVRFPEFEGEEWREVRLGKVFTERKEQGYEDLPLLSVTADEGIIYRDELDRRDTSSADKSRYLRVCKGDIAYNTMRMWQGRSGVSSLEGIVSPAYTVCKPKPSVDSDFMGYLFQFPSVVYLFRRYSQGLVSDTWNLKFRHFAQIHIKIPEIREQRRIVAVLQTCDREIELLTKRRNALQRQKKGLMQRLLTGRVRVKV
jgi:type I restriction enzyme S subunit